MHFLLDSTSSFLCKTSKLTVPFSLSGTENHGTENFHIPMYICNNTTTWLMEETVSFPAKNIHTAEKSPWSLHKEDVKNSLEKSNQRQGITSFQMGKRLFKKRYSGSIHSVILKVAPSEDIKKPVICTKKQQSTFIMYSLPCLLDILDTAIMARLHGWELSWKKHCYERTREPA